MSLEGRRILLVVGGGVAAYKALGLVRLLAKAGASVSPVLTRAGEKFVTPLSLSALTGEPVDNGGGQGVAVASMVRTPAVDPNDQSTWAATPRNAPCPCGSGKKYKHCHGRLA